jgi:hypothetical protein
MSHIQPKARILIVDDEAPQMKALCETLRDQGYETTGFTSAEEALAAFKKAEREFDLLLTDMMMPVMDGITLLRLALETAPDLVGIIMTGHGTIDTAVESMKSGALDYILKPFKLSAILPVLHRALRVRQLRIENRELQEQIRERTIALEASNKELEAFSFSVSHDLRAPLRAIDGFSNILLDRFNSQLPPDGQRYLKNINANAKHMASLIENLLDFSRMGRQTLTMQKVKMNDLVQRIIEKLHSEVQGREVEFRIGRLPDCKGDPLLLEQVLANLLSNAVKFTRKREHALVEMEGKAEGPEVHYFVRDNGAGFDMQFAGNLFGVFQRLHRATDFEGTGVGLSIVQRVIHRHGGAIRAEAEQDKGATFYFTLPKA